jgi:hypothetical protein
MASNPAIINATIARLVRFMTDTPRLVAHSLIGARDGAPVAACWATSPQRINIIAAAITASMTTAMIKRCKGLLIMWWSSPNLVPSGSKFTPHFEHFPGFG